MMFHERAIDWLSDWLTYWLMNCLPDLVTDIDTYTSRIHAKTMWNSECISFFFFYYPSKRSYPVHNPEGLEHSRTSRLEVVNSECLKPISKPFKPIATTLLFLISSPAAFQFFFLSVCKSCFLLNGQDIIPDIIPGIILIFFLLCMQIMFPIKWTLTLDCTDQKSERSN